MHIYFPARVLNFREWERIIIRTAHLPKNYLSRRMRYLGFRISDIMFDGSEEDLRQTNVTQPAVFLHSIIAYKSIDHSVSAGWKPDMVAGHSLGEFSALVANGTLSFDDALKLVFVRAELCKGPVN